MLCAFHRLIRRCISNKRSKYVLLLLSCRLGKADFTCIRQSPPIWDNCLTPKMKTLKDYGYGFNSDGQLRKIDSKTEKPGKEPFEFQISSNHDACQKNYEDIGETITEYVYGLLEKQVKLVRVPVPKLGDISTFIFVSKDFESKNKLLVLIHGSGVVRAGQWARSLIINHNLSTGTQIPYIEKAKEMDYGIVVMNTNDNVRENGTNSIPIPKSSSPEEHAEYVWETYIRPSKAQSIAIIAHSYGGIVTMHLSNKYREDFKRRVKAVAFTDSVHQFAKYKILDHIKKVGRNWVSSKDPLDSPIKTSDQDVAKVSAGHPKHEMTSFSAMESIFSFISEKM